MDSSLSIEESGNPDSWLSMAWKSLDDSLHPQFALQAIGHADVRYGILPSRARFRGDDGLSEVPDNVLLSAALRKHEDIVMSTILITGAGSGIGAGLATELATAGHHIIATDLVEKTAQKVATQIRSSGGQCDALALDVASETSVAALAEQLPAPVDVLINNAGLQYVSRLEDFPTQKWEQLIAVMLTGAAAMTRALLPTMRQNGHGRIVNIGSIHSLVASRYKSAYVAAKHGLLGFSKVMALETADTDITINTICPSYVHTPLVEKQIAGQARENGISEQQVVDEIMLKPMPKGAFISIEELAGIVAFLISPAARNITGQALVVDGGWTVQ